MPICKLALRFYKSRRPFWSGLRNFLKRCSDRIAYDYCIVSVLAQDGGPLFFMSAYHFGAFIAPVFLRVYGCTITLSRAVNVS